VIEKKKKMTTTSITFFDGFATKKATTIDVTFFSSFVAKKVTSAMSSPSSMVVAVVL
jgi:hypothetical protein